MTKVYSLTELEEMTDDERVLHRSKHAESAYNLLQEVAKEYDQIKLTYVADGDHPLTAKSYKEARETFLMHAARIRSL